MKLKVPFINYDAVAGNALDEPVCTFTFIPFRRYRAEGNFAFKVTESRSKVAST
jgi:hypothetical protein